MQIKDLKIGDYVYSFHGAIANKRVDCFEFFKIIKETKCYWILEKGKKARKTDLKEYGGLHEWFCFKIIEGEAKEIFDSKFTLAVDSVQKEKEE